MTCVVERDRLLGIAKPSIWVPVLWQPETLSSNYCTHEMGAVSRHGLLSGYEIGSWAGA